MRHFVIGRGRLGKTILNSLLKTGEVLSGSIEDSDIVWIVIPDSSIKAKVKEIEEKLTEKHILAHCSGLFPASILKNKGTNRLVSLHPAFSFARPLDFFPEGIFWTFEGDNSLFSIFSNLVEKWGGRIKVVSEKQKELYHIACVFASNFPVVSLLIAERLFKDSGLDFDDIRSGLVHPVCRKIVEGDRLIDVLSGPASRNDLKTILKETEILKGYDIDLSEAYRLLSDFVLKNK